MNRIPPELVPEILRLYSSGLGSHEVARRVGVGVKTVFRYVRAAGLAVKPRGGYHGKGGRRSAEED